MDPGIAFILSFQNNAGILAPFFQGIAFLGMPEFYLVVIPLILWCYDRSLGIRLLMLLSVSGALCDALKIAFHSPRPYWVGSEIRAFTQYPSFGFPSGHAMNAVVFFGIITAWVRKSWIRVLCILVILLIGLARIFQAVHYPLDVLGGYLAGLVLLLLFLRYENTMTSWVSKKPVAVQLVLAGAVSGLLLIFSFIALFSLGSWQVPPEWLSLALQQSGVPISPLIPRDTLTSAGLFFGSAVGIIVLSRYSFPEMQGTGFQRGCRYLAGIIVLFVLWISLKGLTNAEVPLGYAAEYLRAGVAGLWITAGAPLLFRILKLSGEKNS